MIDEAHVVIPWSQDFCECYADINCVCMHIPPHVALLAMTATLSPNAERAKSGAESGQSFPEGDLG